MGIAGSHVLSSFQGPDTVACLGAVWNHRHQDSGGCVITHVFQQIFIESHTVLSAEGRVVSKVRNGFLSCGLVKKQDTCQLNKNKCKFFTLKRATEERFLMLDKLSTKLVYTEI